MNGHSFTVSYNDGHIRIDTVGVMSWRSEVMPGTIVLDCSCGWQVILPDDVPLSRLNDEADNHLTDELRQTAVYKRADGSLYSWAPPSQDALYMRSVGVHNPASAVLREFPTELAALCSVCWGTGALDYMTVEEATQVIVSSKRDEDR